MMLADGFVAYDDFKAMEVVYEKRNAHEVKNAVDQNQHLNKYRKIEEEEENEELKKGIRVKNAAKSV